MNRQMYFEKKLLREVTYSVPLPSAMEGNMLEHNKCI